MPLTGKDEEVMGDFEREYPGRGKRVFYATMNRDISRGKTPNLPEARRLAAKRRHKKGGRVRGKRVMRRIRRRRRRS